MIAGFSRMVPSMKAYELSFRIAKASGLIGELSVDDTDEGKSRMQNIEELLNAVKDFSEKEQTLFPDEETGELLSGSHERTLDQFMQEIALLTDADSDDKENNDKVVLMTVHAAKGLEFPYIYIVGLEENLFPSLMSLQTRAEIEEERRLFYVALTRAEKRVTLSYALTRYRWGTMTQNEPSRFLSEIDESFIEQPIRRVASQSQRNPTIQTQPSPQKRNLKKITDATAELPAGDLAEISQIQPGIMIVHERFGKGKVLSVEGTGPNAKASVFFAAAGQKQLLLKFAKLRISK